jgi:transposase-like protein
MKDTLAPTKKAKDSQRFTPEFRAHVLDFIKEKGCSVSDAASRFNIKNSNIHYWLKVQGNKPKIDSISDVMLDKPKKSKKKATMEDSLPNVSFCPCCGTNIKAVAIALSTYNSIAL